MPRKVRFFRFLIGMAMRRVNEMAQSYVSSLTFDGERPALGSGRTLVFGPYSSVETFVQFRSSLQVLLLGNVVRPIHQAIRNFTLTHLIQIPLNP